uniref:Uncharacterized protein n=1 Tax=Anguilla anguilla TaxID=7936 RepID=A0A0E9VX24_ANGAN
MGADSNLPSVRFWGDQRPPLPDW